MRSHTTSIGTKCFKADGKIKQSYEGGIGKEPFHEAHGMHFVVPTG